MALPQFWRYVLVNKSGVALTFAGGGRINIKETALNDDTTNGKTVYTAQTDDDLGFTTGTLADDAEIVGDVERDNTSDLFTGSQVQIEITHDGGTAADGTFDLYMSVGTVTGELQSDTSHASGYESAEANRLDFVGALTWEPSGLDDQVMLSNILHIG